MDEFIPFLSLVFLCAGLGIDNGLLIEFSLRSLGLEEKKHLLWRSVALIMAALLRVVFLFSISQLTFLKEPLPESWWTINRWFSEHPEELTWMSFVLFVGGVIIIGMAMWEFYHKFRAELHGGHGAKDGDARVGRWKVVAVILYLTGMNILFSVDSVFAALAIMDIDTQFWWMVTAILIAAAIMIFGMIPISKIISKNKHFGVLMLTVLAVIASKLMVDGTGAHFSNGLLMFILVILFLNDSLQAAIDWADKEGNKAQQLEAH